MQIAVFERLQARAKFGMAMAANNPTVETTIMISTKVKPRDGWIVFRSSVFTRQDVTRSLKPVQPDDCRLNSRGTTGK